MARKHFHEEKQIVSSNFSKSLDHIREYTLITSPTNDPHHKVPNQSLTTPKIDANTY